MEKSCDREINDSFRAKIILIELHLFMGSNTKFPSKRKFREKKKKVKVYAKEKKRKRIMNYEDNWLHLH